MSIRSRIEKLERNRPNELQDLSDEELNARIDEMMAKPYVQAWLANGSDADSLRLRIIKNLAQETNDKL